MKDARDRGPSVGLEPVPGLYKYRWYLGPRSYGPWVPARIDWVTPIDPETGEVLDRAIRLRCLIAGEEVEALDVWPLWPASEEEYRRLLDTMPDDPRQPIKKVAS